MLPRSTGKEDESLAVGFETSDICGERFDGEIGATRVDGDTDCRGEFARDTGFLLIIRKKITEARESHGEGDSTHLELSKRKATSRSYTAIVLDCRAADYGP